MSRVLILVEGQTEETFIRDVLAPYFLPRGIYCIPKLATTKRVKSGPHFKGGITSYPKVKNDIDRLLGDTGAAVVTTMIDYYGFSSIAPYKNSITGKSCFDRVASLEKLFKDNINNPKFLPYLQTHEFEALVFVSPEEILNAFIEPNKRSSLLAICNQFSSPEEINDHPETVPSRRLESLFPKYKKRWHGPLITKRIGLDNIRVKCNHFNQWIQQLEAISQN
jgi:hypothetical protein